MGDRTKYNSCMKPYMSGKAGAREDRQMNFCIGAKICSGKAKNEDEAKKLCLLPKAPKSPKAPKRSAKQLEKEREACAPEVFNNTVSRFNNLYLTVSTPRCSACEVLDDLIRQAEIPYPIVQIPESCVELHDLLEVDAFPTVIRMSKGKVVSRFVGNPKDTIEKMKQGL